MSVAGALRIDQPLVMPLPVFVVLFIEPIGQVGCVIFPIPNAHEDLPDFRLVTPPEFSCRGIAKNRGKPGQDLLEPLFGFFGGICAALEAEGNQAIAAILATADPRNKTVAPSGGVSFDAVFS